MHIFSSPANVTPWKGAKAVAFASLPPALGYGDFSRLAYQIILTGFFGFHRSMVWLQSLWDKEAFENNYAYYRILKMDDLPNSQLFLYSQADGKSCILKLFMYLDICTPESIEEFQAIQKIKGKQVRPLSCWTGFQI